MLGEVVVAGSWVSVLVVVLLVLAIVYLIRKL